MDDTDIRAFVAREWAAVAREKARFWADRKPTMSPAEAMALGDELRRHAQSIRPGWPGPGDRAEDLDAHRRVSEALRACPRSSPR